MIRVMQTPWWRCASAWMNYIVKQTLEEDVHNIIQCQWEAYPLEEVKLLNLSPLSHEIWGEFVPEGFKPPCLPKFDGHIDPYIHATSINTQMAIIGGSYSLKYKLLSSNFINVALRWYTDLPRAFMKSYQELVRNPVHQFAASRDRKMSTTSKFNILQGQSELLRDYLVRINEATIRVIPSNQEMFIEAL